MGWLKKNITLHEKETILFDAKDIEKDDEGNYLVDIAYRRVSTEKQSLEGFGLDIQLEHIERCCREERSTSCILITDDGFTGTVMERPGLDCFIRRLNDFNTGKTNIRIRKFIIPRMDRLGRTLLGTLQFIQDYIVKKEGAKSTINQNRYLVEFISCRERFIKIVTNEYGEIEPSSNLVLSIFSCFAEFDRNQIVAKLRDGKEKRIAAGYPLGGGNQPFGYKYVIGKDGYGNYETIPEEKEKFLEARRLFLEEHLSPSAIHMKLGLSTEQLVINMLKRRTYLNLIEHKGKEYPGHFEAFITEDQWQEQQDEFAKRSRKFADSCYLLTSLVYCGNCGAKLRYQKDFKSGTIKLVCYSKEKSKSKQHLVKDPNCPNKIRYYAQDIENIVINELFKLSYNNNKENTKTVSTIDVVSEMEKEISRHQSALKKATMKYALSEEGTAQAIALEDVIEELSCKIDKLAEQLFDEKQKQNVVRKVNNVKTVISNLKDAWNFMTPEEKRSVCRQVIEKVVITYTDKNPEVNVYFQLEKYLNK